MAVRRSESTTALLPEPSGSPNLAAISVRPPPREPQHAVDAAGEAGRPVPEPPPALLDWRGWHGYVKREFRHPARTGGDTMTQSKSKRVLILANRTAATPRLADAVRERARRGECSFALLVPAEDPSGESAEQTLELSIPILEEAAGTRIERLVGDPNPLVAVRQALQRGGGYDEVIVSTLPERVSRWLHRDLPRRIEELGVPVTVVVAQQAPRPVWDEEVYRSPPTLP